MKKISVIVPIYNIEQYLEKCLYSILDQTFESYEVILVEDGSTDNSKEIAERFVELHSDKFKLVCQENRGLSGARNTGMLYATGEYVCFIDSDDTVAPTYLEVLYQQAKYTGAELVVCAFHSVDENGNSIKTYREDLVSGQVYNLHDEKKVFLIQNAAWNKLYKREVIVDNNLQFTEGAWYEDLRFTKKYLLLAQRIVYCDQVLYNYLQRAGSIMSNMGSKRNAEILDALEEVAFFYKENGVYEEFKSEIELIAIEHVYISALVRLIRAGEKKQIQVIRKEFEKKYPNYKKNKYLKKLERNRLIIYWLLNLKCYQMIKWIFLIKGEGNA